MERIGWMRTNGFGWRVANIIGWKHRQITDHKLMWSNAYVYINMPFSHVVTWPLQPTTTNLQCWPPPQHIAQWWCTSTLPPCYAHATSHEPNHLKWPHLLKNINNCHQHTQQHQHCQRTNDVAIKTINSLLSFMFNIYSKYFHCLYHNPPNWSDTTPINCLVVGS